MTEVDFQFWRAFWLAAAYLAFFIYCGTFP